MGAVAVLAGCGPEGSGGSRESVVASFYPLAFAAQEIGGRRVDVQNLTPPGSEPHDLEATPKDVAAVGRASLVLLLGRGFQPQLEDAAGHRRSVLRLLDTHGLAVHGNDPHVWLDPLRYAKMVEPIGRALRAPAATARFVGRLGALNREYQHGLAHCARRDVVTSHEAFAYLAERYRLHQIAVTGLSPEAEPEPGQLRRVVDLVRARGVTTIYFETLVSPRIADTVARETGARTAVLDPIEGLTQDEEKRGENYFTLMRKDLRALEQGLGCR